MRVILLIIFFLISANAEDITKTPPLIGTVKNVPRGDVLNIRAKPNYRTKKIGFLKNAEDVEVFKCIRVGSKSIWCKIGFFGIKAQMYEGFKGVERGWVNAKYLNLSYSFYAMRNEDLSREDGLCIYSLGCKNGICKIIDSGGVSKIKRSKISAFFPYGGYCDYIVIPGEKVQKYKNLKFLVLDVDKWVSSGYVDKMKQRIHPKKGVLITYYTTFARKNKHFSADSFAKFYNSDKKLYWGESDGRGDKIYLSLREFFNEFHNYNGAYEDDVKKVNPSRFDFPYTKGVVAYEIAQKSDDNSWKHLVVVLQKYKGRYYVVGLLFNRWTI